MKTNDSTKAATPTPTPWQVVYGEWNGPEEEGISVMDADGETYLALVWSDFEAEPNEPPIDGIAPAGTADANARLIVRAVNAHADLLAQLRECSDFLDNYVDVVDGEDGRPRANRAMALKADVDAAIAQAGAK